MPYEPNTWNNGDTITAEKLNHLEQGVASASQAVPAATTQAAGVVKQAAAVSDLSGAPTQGDFNGLLAALRAAGLMAAE